jgi:hypothetical protein
MAEVWGYPCARERSDEPLPLPGAAPPLKASPEGWVCEVMLAMRLARHRVLVMFFCGFLKGKEGTNRGRIC